MSLVETGLACENRTRLNSNSGNEGEEEEDFVNPLPKNSPIQTTQRPVKLFINLQKVDELTLLKMAQQPKIRKNSQKDNSVLSYNDPDAMKDIKNCIKLPSTELVSKTNLEVKVSKGKIINNGLFRKNGIRVVIQVMPVGWKVSRSDEDFDWLHQCIRSKFLGNYIPELPHLQITEDATEEDSFLVEEYLRQVLSISDLKYSTELQDFLKLGEKEFSLMRSRALPSYVKKASDILEFNKDKPITRYSTPSGTVELDMNTGIGKIASEISKLATSTANSSKLAEDLCEQIADHLLKAAQLTDKLSRYLVKMNNDYSDFFDHNRVKSVDELTKLHNIGTSMVQDMTKSLKHKAELFKKDFSRFFQISVIQNEGFISLVDRRNEFSSTYQDAKINLEKKKASLFEVKDLRRWGIDQRKLNISPQTLFNNQSMALKLMLPDETSSVRNLRDFVGYLNKQLFSEIETFSSQLLSSAQSLYGECNSTAQSDQKILEKHTTAFSSVL